MTSESLYLTDKLSLELAATGQLKRLGKNARRCFERADRGECAIYIPTSVFAELSEACHYGKITLGQPFEEWMRAALESSKYHEAPLTAEIVCRAHQLFDIPERGDRLIAATAVVMEVPLITRDPEIAMAALVECVW